MNGEAKHMTITGTILSFIFYAFVLGFAIYIIIDFICDREIYIVSSEYEDDKLSLSLKDSFFMLKLDKGSV